MAKLAVAKKIGVPVPATIPADVTHIVAYFGAKGFTPNYAQAERVLIPVADAPRQTKDGVEYFVFDSAQLPSVDGETDVYFTLRDNADDEEGDFSPVVTLPLADREAPVTLEAPVLLD